MDFKKLMKAKMDAQSELLNKAMRENRALTPDEQKQFDNLEIEIKNLEKSIEMQAKIDQRNQEHNTPVNEPMFAQPRNTDQGLRLFDNLADQLRAVKNAAVNGVVDDRLAKLNNQVKAAAQGANEGLPEEGGYAVQSDFAGMMMESAVKAGQILPKVDKYEISSGANRVEWTEIDEASVATTVFGGVQVYWASEAAAVAASKPKLKEMEIKLQKLMGIAYATYELEQDSNFISQLYNKAFTLAIQRELENVIISANGVGKPLGFLKGGSLVSVDKEKDQAAGTVVWENISKMYHRAINKDDPNYVWLVHPDVSQMFDFLHFPVGTGGVPVYLPAAQQGAVTTLKAHAVIESDHCSELGTVGDINYVDLSQYMLVTKGGVQADTSMHVQFLTAENCFRFIFRANGMPKKNKALMIKNSKTPRSSFVTLAARA